ncbi:hypothetical protein UCRPA7_2843 [Phaeoacremonium minimum UCRPA7]|uniref:Uncharacterized protein n=1 Tax=Phaeoacremonium minimum (strain UCR-PA7) TaxID=1286976 RepID=R8BQJ3_PHAM7|nr:hypothetical protein UCRPA7_2843 [Phaeoacremonium minimum UCRPA7]EOO01631.1 hypothetical protein UCRPA7_2843 [Phaeoacremonium minimum UCRPA7]
MASRPISKKVVQCIGSAHFEPHTRVKSSEARTAALAALEKNDLAAAIRDWFQLPANDSYTYHAMTSVTLAQVQHVVSLGAANNLHAWYADPETKEPLQPPPQADIEAYITIFQANSATASALKGFASNAKKNSLRASVATHITEKRYIHPAAPSLTISKNKSPPPNPYFDFWAWSCRNLEWCGPCAASEARPQSHHVLPIFMHHFGCAVPSYESLEMLRILAAGRTVADVGSGNGYWSFMLRQHGVSVVPVDNQQSEWRANWVNDTVIADGVKWLGRKENAGGKDMVLLLVYPVVGGGLAGGVEGGFTRGLMAAYQGDTVAVVGTQNRNGYTGFKDMIMNEYMEKEQKDWTKVVQIPLPSFAGKDEALFVYQRGDRAPKESADLGVSAKT